MPQLFVLHSAAFALITFAITDMHPRSFVLNKYGYASVFHSNYFNIMRNRLTIKKYFYILTLGLLCATARADTTLTGRCTAVTDGDTVKVLIDKQEVKVRLFGIDAPEKSQPFGNQAKKFMSDAVFGKTITVRATGKDRYGRTLGWIYIDKRNINSEIIKAGYAWWYKQYAKKYPSLGVDQEKAKAAKRGLWVDQHAMAPWEWRKQQRQKHTK